MITRRAQRVLNEGSEIFTNKLAAVLMRGGVVVKDDRGVAPDVVGGAQVAMNRTIQRAKFHDTANQCTSLKVTEKKIYDRENLSAKKSAGTYSSKFGDQPHTRRTPRSVKVDQPRVAVIQAIGKG